MAAVEETGKTGTLWKRPKHLAELIVDDQTVIVGAAAIQGTEALIKTRRIAAGLISTLVRELGAVTRALQNEAVPRFRRLDKHPHVVPNCRRVGIQQFLRLIPDVRERARPQLGIVDAAVEPANVFVIVHAYAQRPAAAHRTDGGFVILPTHRHRDRGRPGRLRPKRRSTGKVGDNKILQSLAEK